MNISIACETKDTLPLEKIEPLQGNLKTLAGEDLQRLCGEIMKTGFAFPILVWKDPKSKKHYCVGGHQRVKALQHLQKTGWSEKKNGAIKPVNIPEVPVVYVHAKTIKDAKRRVIQDVAQYGRVTGEGLKGFLDEMDLDVEDLLASFRIPEVNMVSFLSAPTATDANKEWEGMPDFDQQDQSGFRHLIVHFIDQAGVDEFFKKIGQKDTGETKTVWFPPQERMDTEAKRYGK